MQEEHPFGKDIAAVRDAKRNIKHKMFSNVKIPTKFP